MLACETGGEPEALVHLLAQCVQTDLTGAPRRHWWTSLDVREMLEHVRVSNATL